MVENRRFRRDPSGPWTGVDCNGYTRETTCQVEDYAHPKGRVPLLIISGGVPLP